MKKMSITFKLFVITASVLVIFISATLLLQTVFFESFYERWKMRTLENSLNDFKASYVAGGMTLNDMMASMQEIGDKNNAEVALINNNDNFSLVTGSIQDQGDQSRTEIMRAAVAQWALIARTYQTQLKKGETVTYTIVHPRYRTNNIVKIVPIVKGDNVQNVIVAVASLQPIGEAASVVSEFYIYIYGAAIVFIVVLSLIYSNMISKPLVNLNNTASRMAQMDFSERCKVSSYDEIGNLAGTLNFLSEKLGNTLGELKDANEKLKADIEKERSLEKMRKEFVAGVSHELKTPITLIEGYAEGLKENIAEDEKRDFYIDVIMDEAEKMGRLVTDMLDLSRLDSGNTKLNMEEFYIDELAGSITRKYSNNVQEKKIDIIYESYEENVLVYGDRFRIDQVITNFLNNAVKHTAENGSIHLSIKGMQDKVRIEVENQGEHIDENEMKNIWEKFYKIEKSRNRDMGGTGLGLAISKNILQLHNSEFGVVNTEEGVKFYFTLSKAL